MVKVVLKASAMVEVGGLGGHRQVKIPKIPKHSPKMPEFVCMLKTIFDTVFEANGGQSDYKGLCHGRGCRPQRSEAGKITENDRQASWPWRSKAMLVLSQTYAGIDFCLYILILVYVCLSLN